MLSVIVVVIEWCDGEWSLESGIVVVVVDWWNEDVVIVKVTDVISDCVKVD